MIAAFPGNGVDTVDVKACSQTESYFWPLRHFVISLLQARSYTVWERLVILGLFMQKLESLQDEGFRSVPGLIEQYCGTVPGGALQGISGFGAGSRDNSGETGPGTGQ